MSKVSGIYKIVSISNPDKVYIGSSHYILKRFSKHLRDLKRGGHDNGRLQNHFNKYGEFDLVYSLIEECDECNLLIREQFYIDELKPFFNICITAGSRKGVIVSDETKKKLSEHFKGKPSNRKGAILSEETKQKISNAKKGQVAWNKGLKTGAKSSTQFKKGSIPWNKGITKELNPLTGRKKKPHTEEAKLKMSLAKKGKPSNRRKNKI